MFVCSCVDVSFCLSVCTRVGSFVRLLACECVQVCVGVRVNAGVRVSVGVRVSGWAGEFKLRNDKLHWK